MSGFEQDKLGQFKGLPKGGENNEKKKGGRKKGAGNKKKVSDTDVVAQNREPTIRFKEKGILINKFICLTSSNFVVIIGNPREILF